jgi:GalNAc-alpha-(1->4)-GalNAc-alpha-(1->3)-diNAcBac-PP-undecaprenol alpha-1,4-N-acetyl-D-galactosaminyltransferase
MSSDRFLLFIGSLKKGGAERNAAMLSNHLVQLGHQVTLVMFVKEIAFELDPRVKIEQINHKRFGNTILNTLYVLLRLRMMVFRIRPRRLIAMSRIGSLFASCLFFPRTIVRFDIYPLIGYRKYKQRQFWFLYNLPWVKYVICPSQELRDDVEHFFINKNKLRVIYNPAVFVRKPSGDFLKPVRPYFLMVTRLHDQKNVDKLIQTFYDHKLYEKADLLVAGDGPEMNKLKAQVVALGMSNHIQLLGFVGNPEPYIEHAITLINASMREGFPNVVVEALSLGTPVLCSAAKTGPREIIFDGENGFLFDVGDYAKLGQLMNDVVMSPELHLHLKQRTSKGLDRFSKEEVMRSWSTVLN